MLLSTSGTCRRGDCSPRSASFPLYAWLPFIRDKTGCAHERPSGSVRGTPVSRCLPRSTAVPTRRNRASLQVQARHGLWCASYPPINAIIALSDLFADEETHHEPPCTRLRLKFASVF